MKGCLERHLQYLRQNQANHACMADDNDLLSIAAYYLLVKRCHPLRHGVVAFALGGRHIDIISKPASGIIIVDTVPRLHFPCAKVVLEQTCIKQWLRMQIVGKLEATLQRTAVDFRAILMKILR